MDSSPKTFFSIVHNIKLNSKCAHTFGKIDAGKALEAMKKYDRTIKK
jgi:hypothetical protein